jgi:hypothetical protein
MTADNYRQIAHRVRQAARYERADGKATGYRNGYRPGQMKTAEGMVEFSAPQVRDAPETRHTLRGDGAAATDVAAACYETSPPSLKLLRTPDFQGRIGSRQKTRTGPLCADRMPEVGNSRRASCRDTSLLSFAPEWRSHQVQVVRPQRGGQLIHRHNGRVAVASFDPADVLLAKP